MKKEGGEGRERKEGGYSTISLRMCECVCAWSWVSANTHTALQVVFLTPGWTVYYLQPRDYPATLKARDLTREHDPREEREERRERKERGGETTKEAKQMPGQLKQPGNVTNAVNLSNHP